MSETPTQEELPALVIKGLALVEERLRNSLGAQIYLSIRAQLLYVKGVVIDGEPADEARSGKLLLGLYAAREFETSDPEFADVISSVHYLFDRR